jgi:hypothetical protein
VPIRYASILALLASRNMTPIVLLAVRFVIKNVITANDKRVVKLPVTFIPKGIKKYLRITQRKIVS